MKTIILILTIAALAVAAPKPSTMRYRSLYKTPIKEIEAKPAPRIIGGQEAVPHTLPYQVMLEDFAETEGWYCDGSLISANYVLTAAHCLDGAYEHYTFLGTHNFQDNEDTQLILVSYYVAIHEEWDPNLIINDIGIIRLSQTVTFTDAIQPIALPSDDETSLYVNTTGRISGWGITDYQNPAPSSVLRYANVRVISNEDCEKVYGPLPDSNLCTSGENNSGICDGDSGGPLVVYDTQVGIASFGYLLCQPGYPSGFTRVTSYISWIQRHTDIQ